MDTATLLKRVMRFFRGTALPTATELTNTGSTPGTNDAPVSNPWLGATALNQGIVTNLGGGTGYQVSCILRDGHGQPIPYGVLKVYPDRAVTGLNAVVPGTGTKLYAFNGSNDAFGAVLGGCYAVQANASGAVKVAINVGAVAAPGARVTLEHLGHTVTCQIITT